MTKNIKIFIVVDAILAAAMVAIMGWYFDTGGNETLIFIFAGIIYTFVVSDLIHRLSGVPTLKNKRILDIAKPGDLTHQQFEALNRYWNVELAVFSVVGLAYVGLFQRDNRHVAFLILGFIFAGLIIWFLTYVDRKQKIKGYSKKDLFQ